MYLGLSSCARSFAMSAFLLRAAHILSPVYYVLIHRETAGGLLPSLPLACEERDPGFLLVSSGSERLNPRVCEIGPGTDDIVLTVFSAAPHWLHPTTRGCASIN